MTEELKHRGPVAGLKNHAIDILMAVAQERLCAKNRTEAHLLAGIPAPVASKLRGGKIELSAEFLLRLHDATGKSVEEIRTMFGLKKYDFTGKVE